MRWKEPNSLNDTHDCKIRIICKCGHTAVWHGKAMALLFYRRKWEFRFNAVQRRCWCSRCKAREPKFETFDGPIHSIGGHKLD